VGLWEELHVKTFQDGVKENVGKLGAGPFCVYVDITEYPPQRPDITKGAREWTGYWTRKPASALF
jgi:hypothetical protein